MHTFILSSLSFANTCMNGWYRHRSCQMKKVWTEVTGKCFLADGARLRQRLPRGHSWIRHRLLREPIQVQQTCNQQTCTRRTPPSHKEPLLSGTLDDRASTSSAASCQGVEPNLAGLKGSKRFGKSRSLSRVVWRWLLWERAPLQTVVHSM